MDPPASIQNDDVVLMAKVQPQRSGLPFVVYISEKQGRHDVRVNVAAGEDGPPFLASVAVRPTIAIVEGSLTSGDFELVRDWIALNRSVIINFLERSAQVTADALAALKAVPRP